MRIGLKMSRLGGMPKWLVQTLRDNKIDAPMSSRTRSGFQHTSYASDCYALASF